LLKLSKKYKTISINNNDNNKTQILAEKIEYFTDKIKNSEDHGDKCIITQEISDFYTNFSIDCKCISKLYVLQVKDPLFTVSYQGVVNHGKNCPILEEIKSYKCACYKKLKYLQENDKEFELKYSGKRSHGIKCEILKEINDYSCSCHYNMKKLLILEPNVKFDIDPVIHGTNCNLTSAIIDYKEEKGHYCQCSEILSNLVDDYPTFKVKAKDIKHGINCTIIVEVREYLAYKSCECNNYLSEFIEKFPNYVFDKTNTKHGKNCDILRQITDNSCSCIFEIKEMKKIHPYYEVIDDIDNKHGVDCSILKKLNQFKHTQILDKISYLLNELKLNINNLKELKDISESIYIIENYKPILSIISDEINILVKNNKPIIEEDISEIRTYDNFREFSNSRLSKYEIKYRKIEEITNTLVDIEFYKSKCKV